MDSNARAGRGSAEGPALRDYIEVMLRRWWVVAAALALTVGAALAWSLLSSPVYRSEAMVVVDRGGSSLNLSPDLMGFSQQTYVETLAGIVKSRAVTGRAVEALGVPENRRGGAAAALRRGLRVQRVRGSDLIRIQAEGPTGEAAAKTTNAVAQSFLAWHVEQRRGRASVGRQFIESQIGSLSVELRKAENALVKHKVSGGQVALTEQTAAKVERLAEFEALQRVATTQRQAAAASLRQMRSSLAEHKATIPSTFVTSEDPVVAQLRADLARLEVELAGLRPEFTDRHPRVLAVQSRIEETKEGLRQQTARRLASETAALNPIHQQLVGQAITLEVEQQALEAREAALGAQVRRYALELVGLPPKEVELARLTRDVRVAEETYLLLSQRLAEARISEASVVGDLSIVDSAEPSPFPVKPNLLFNLILGALAGLVLGVVGAAVVEAMDTTFRSPEEAGLALGLPVLATVPDEKGPRRPEAEQRIALMTGEGRASPFAESLRLLRASLLYLSPDRPLHTLIVTSPGVAEGKSTVAAALAVAIARGGQTVRLIECDLRRPTLAWTFQPEGAFGLTDMLANDLPAEQAVQKTAVENLWLLPSGTKPPNPAELLGSQKMRALLEQGREAVDVQVLDAPPMLPVADTTLLAPAVDGVVLVVHLSRTPRAAAERARQQLDAVGARVLGLVVNGVKARRGAYYTYTSDERPSSGR